MGVVSINENICPACHVKANPPPEGDHGLAWLSGFATASVSHRAEIQVAVNKLCIRHRTLLDRLTVHTASRRIV